MLFIASLNKKFLKALLTPRCMIYDIHIANHLPKILFNNDSQNFKIRFQNICIYFGLITTCLYNHKTHDCTCKTHDK